MTIVRNENKLLKSEQKQEFLVRDSCLERTGKEPDGVEIW